jgi:hypothetical protein
MAEARATMVRCQQCDASWSSPTLRLEAREQVVRLHHDGDTIGAIRLLREQGELSLKDAKVVLYHLADDQATCHHCRSVIKLAGEGPCPACGAFVYNWGSIDLMRGNDD